MSYQGCLLSQFLWQQVIWSGKNEAQLAKCIRTFSRDWATLGCDIEVIGSILNYGGRSFIKKMAKVLIRCLSVVAAH
jgi:hypothetical protein